MKLLRPRRTDPSRGAAALEISSPASPAPASVSEPAPLIHDRCIERLLASLGGNGEPVDSQQGTVRDELGRPLTKTEAGAFGLVECFCGGDGPL